MQINLTLNAKLPYVLTANVSKIKKSALPNIIFILKPIFEKLVLFLFGLFFKDNKRGCVRASEYA